MGLAFYSLDGIQVTSRQIYEIGFKGRLMNKKMFFAIDVAI